MSLQQGKPRTMNSLTNPEILVVSKVLISLTCGSDRDSKRHKNIYIRFLLPGEEIYLYFPQFELQYYCLPFRR